MQPNPGSTGGWRCRIRYRETQRGNPAIAARNQRRVVAGRTYLGSAATAEQAARINQHVRNRLAQFKARQATERKENVSWPEPRDSPAK